MARTTLAVQQITLGGATPALVAGDAANGHDFVNDGHTFLHIKNTGGAAVTVTIQTPAKVGGMDVSELEVSIPATNGDRMIGPFNPTIFNQTNQRVNVNLSSDTGVTIGAFNLA